EGGEAPHGQRSATESDEHGRLAADIIGEPAKEGARDPVQNVVNDTGHHERCAGDSEEHNLDLVEPEIACDGPELRGGHEAAASPRRSANHFSALPTQVPYTHPAPMPDMIAATYSRGSEFATLFRLQPMAAIMPPTMTTIFGPNLSTNQPSIGISHVSVSTKT